MSAKCREFERRPNAEKQKRQGAFPKKRSGLRDESGNRQLEPVHPDPHQHCGQQRIARDFA